MAAGARPAAAAGVALAGYAALAWATRGDGAAAGWLLAAQALGWLALAAAWRLRNEELDTRAAGAVVVAGAVLFRLCGIWTTPGWEDDYFRHLWDGWTTWSTGSPYGVAPLEWFGAGDAPPALEAVLDGVNHPEHATIYGPVAQAWAAAAATGAGAGRLWVFKAGLVAAEGAGLWALWRAGGMRALLFAGWCPLAVTEIAFAGHVDGLALAAVAFAVLAAKRGRAAAACGWLALACATKGYALLLAPFFLWRGGRRGAGCFAAVLAAAYAPWVAATVAAGREAGAVLGSGGVGAMAGWFEFNSSGYAVLAWALGDEAGRWAAGALLAGGLAAGWIWWARRGGEPAGAGAAGVGDEEGSRAVQRRGAARDGWWVPGAAVVGWWALWSPVFHPWYALLAVPFLALRPSGWGVGLLVALPLSYLHGLTAGAGGTGDFSHPGWVRPAEASVVALAAWVAWRRREVAGSEGA